MKDWRTHVDIIVKCWYVSAQQAGPRTPTQKQKLSRLEL